MIHIVYPLGKGSTWGNNELRYSLRSVEKHLKGYGEVWIIGEKPDWLTNVIHVPISDPKIGIPDTNIMRKLMAFCGHDVEKFLYMNDDHYLLRDIDAETFPYYYHGTIAEYVKKRGHDGYGNRCENTQKSLESRNLPTKYFDIHYPMLMNKTDFMQQVVQHYNPELRHGMVIKSLYANALNIEGTEIKDCKIPPAPLTDQPCFSTYPTVNNKTAQFLREKFPQKSNFEL